MEGNEIIDMEDLKPEENENTGMEDDQTVLSGASGHSDTIFYRCTIKMSFTTKESAHEDCINKLREIFKMFQSARDSKSFIASWHLEDEIEHPYVGHPTQIPMECSPLCAHTPKLFIRKGQGSRTECLQLRSGHLESFISLKRTSKDGYKCTPVMFSTTCCKLKKLWKQDSSQILT